MLLSKFEIQTRDLINVIDCNGEGKCKQQQAIQCNIIIEKSKNMISAISQNRYSDKKSN